jgi:hypothetical protein
MSSGDKIKASNSSPALPGKLFTQTQFINWIKKAENSGTVSIQEAKLLWEKRRKIILNSFE